MTGILLNWRNKQFKGGCMDRLNFLKSSLLGLMPAAAASPITNAVAATNDSFMREDFSSFKTTAKYPMVDSHLHYVDFLQQTDGLKQLTGAMDSCGVAASVLFGMQWSKCGMRMLLKNHPTICLTTQGAITTALRTTSF